MYQIIAGLGVGPNFQAPLIALQSLVEARDIATATATFGFTRNLATSISVVVGGVIFQNGMQRKNEALLAAGVAAGVAGRLTGGSAGANTAVVVALPGGQRRVAEVAFTDSLRTMWGFYVAVSAVGLCASLFVGRHALSKKVEVHRTGLAGGGKEEGKEVEGRSRDGMEGREGKEEV